MTPADWSALVERYRELQEEWNVSRGNADARSRCSQAQLKLIAQAATRLPARGDVVHVIESALLRAAIDSCEHLLAVDVVVHRKQFPRRFLAAVVGAAVRHGRRGGERIIQVATDAYGGDSVLCVLIAIAKVRGLEDGVADFFLYYIGRSRIDVGLEDELRSLTTKR